MTHRKQLHVHNFLLENVWFEMKCGNNFLCFRLTTEYINITTILNVSTLKSAKVDLNIEKVNYSNK